MILDTFVSIFTADVDGLKKGYADSEKSVKDIRHEMSKAETQAAKTKDSLVKFAKGAAGFLASVAAARKLVGVSIREAETINILGQTADAIGSNVSELDAMGKAFGDMGASADSTAEAIRKLMARSEGDARSGTEQMLAFAESIEGLNKAAAADEFRKMGITDRRVQEQLLKGRKALEDQMRTHKQAGVVTKEQVEIAQRYSDAQSKLSTAMQAGARSVMSAVLPAVTWVIEKLAALVGWMNKNKPFVIGFFSALALIAATTYAQAMWVAATATLAATWPILAIAAAIGIAATAIAAIVDDIYNWIQGNDSLLGQMIEKYPIIGDIIDGIVAFVKDLIEGFKQLHALAVDAFVGILEGGAALVKGWQQMVQAMVGAIVDGFQRMKDFVTGIIDWIMSKVQAVTGTIGKVKNLVPRWMRGGGKDGEDSSPEEAAGAAVSSVAARASADFESAEQAVQGAQAATTQLQAAQSTPLNSTTSSVINNGNQRASSTENSVTIGELKIETQATDAAGVSSDIRSELRDQLDNLNAETASGVVS